MLGGDIYIYICVEARGGGVIAVEVLQTIGTSKGILSKVLTIHYWVELHPESS